MCCCCVSVVGFRARLGACATQIWGDVICCPPPPRLRDHDLEGMSDGFDPATAYGAIEGYDDPAMGWSRCVAMYCNTT